MSLYINYINEKNQVCYTWPLSIFELLWNLPFCFLKDKNKNKKQQTKKYTQKASSQSFIRKDKLRAGKQLPGTKHLNIHNKSYFAELTKIYFIYYQICTSLSVLSPTYISYIFHAVSSQFCSGPTSPVSMPTHTIWTRRGSIPTPSWAKTTFSTLQNP